jgi:hypothetical protein
LNISSYEDSEKTLQRDIEQEAKEIQNGQKMEQACRRGLVIQGRARTEREVGGVGCRSGGRKEREGGRPAGGGFG